MSFDLGDPIPLAIVVKDAAGTPANAGAVVLTITLPDGTATTPALSNLSAGNYTPTTPFITTQAGRHLTRWVATGTNACTSSDVFNVIAGDPRFLMSLAEARTAIGLPANNTTKDEDLRGYVAAVTTVVEDVTGPVLSATKVRTVNGCGDLIVMPEAVTSVTSIVENGVTLNPATDYIVNGPAGIITRGTTLSEANFANGRQNVVITYKVGSGVLSEAVVKAARIILRQMWQADQQGFRPQFGAVESDTVTTPMGFLVPKRAYELLKATPAMPGFA